MNMDDLWVFGYGSLMWRPDFEFVEQREATLYGFSRRFCLKSVRYRGTPESPGLVLGLDADAAASCCGVAFRIAPDKVETVCAYLTERELVTRSYHETFQLVRLDDAEGSEVRALCYVVDRAHPQYAGGLSLREQAEVICRSIGPRGANCEYLHNTVSHLKKMGVSDREMEELDRMVRAQGCRKDAQVIT